MSYLIFLHSNLRPSRTIKFVLIKFVLYYHDSILIFVPLPLFNLPNFLQDVYIIYTERLSVDTS